MVSHLTVGDFWVFFFYLIFFFLIYHHFIPIYCLSDLIKESLLLFWYKLCMYKHWFQWTFILCYYWGTEFQSFYSSQIFCLICITNVFKWSGFKCCHIFSVSSYTSCFLYWIHFPTQFTLNCTLFKSWTDWTASGSYSGSLRFFFLIFISVFAKVPFA